MYSNLPPPLDGHIQRGVAVLVYKDSLPPPPPVTAVLYKIVQSTADPACLSSVTKTGYCLGCQKFYIDCHHSLAREYEVVSIKNTHYYCIAGNRTWLDHLPQSKIITYNFIWHNAIVWNINKFLAVRQVWAWWPLASVVLTVRFLVTWLGNVWEPVPPRSTGLSGLFSPLFLGLTLSHSNAVTWTCD